MTSDSTVFSEATPTLEEAVTEFLDSRDAAAPSTRGYRIALSRLSATFPQHRLSAFDGPDGPALVEKVLLDNWGDKASETYRMYLSRMHTFFEWHRRLGNLSTDPTTGLTYPAIKRKPRRAITPADVEALLRANGDPRDSVPLRLLLELGLQKDALQALRFSDLDAFNRTATYQRRGERHTRPVPDEKFWIDVSQLMELRQADESDFVLCYEQSRVYRATPDELAEMERTGALDNGKSYLWRKYDGRWYRAKLTPTRARGDHGVHDWWYRCVARARLVEEGTTSDLRMQSARYTVGRRRWTDTGDLVDLKQHLGGLGNGGWVADVYRNRDADALDQVIRRVRRRARLHRTEHLPTACAIDGSRPLAKWWKEPFRVFADYVEDERDLVELSRVSVAMLRSEEATADRLRIAVEALTRAVTPGELLKRAQNESSNDHSLLHGHSLVAIWSALETMLGDVVETWLTWWPPSRQRVAAFVSLPAVPATTPEEWAFAVRQLLDRQYQKRNQQVRSPRRLDYYEWQLDAIGLGPSPDDYDQQIAENLWDMQQIRNVFAHKRGVADARLVANSPHLPFGVNDEIRIGRNAWSDFLVTAMLYADAVVRRAKREFGLTEWMRSIPAPWIRFGDFGGDLGLGDGEFRRTSRT
jgi:hypothetical protein